MEKPGVKKDGNKVVRRKKVAPYTATAKMGKVSKSIFDFKIDTMDL